MNIKGIETDLGDIVRHLHEQTGIEHGLIANVLEKFIMVLPDALSENGGRVELNHLGVFRLDLRAPRHGKTPDGKPWSTPERQEIVFHASPEMQEVISVRTGIETY